MGDWMLYLVVFLIGFFAWFTCWIFYGYASFIGTLIFSAREVDLPESSARDINASLFVYPSVTSVLEGSGFCSALIKSCAV